MIYRWIVTVMCALLFAGCVSTSGQMFPERYTLLAANASHAPSTSAHTENRKTLRVARLQAPAWIEGTGMYYRLDYRHDARIAAYARSDWAAPPAALLEQVLQQRLARSGAWRAVIGPGGSAQADFSVHVRVDNFIQVFKTPQKSAGVLDAVATLVNTQTGAVVGQKNEHIEVPAPSADAAGGAKALNRASQSFAAELERWLQTETGAGPHA